MCDQDTFASVPLKAKGVTRREFARIGAVAGASALAVGTGATALAQSRLSEKEVKFPAPGGTAPASATRAGRSIDER